MSKPVLYASRRKSMHYAVGNFSAGSKRLVWIPKRLMERCEATNNLLMKYPNIFSYRIIQKVYLAKKEEWSSLNQDRSSLINFLGEDRKVADDEKASQCNQ